MSIEARNRLLPDWFTRIRTCQTVLPRFQRFEAWDHSRVTQLYNTILQDLPVGAGLVLEIGNEQPFISRTLKGAPETGERLSNEHPNFGGNINEVHQEGGLTTLLMRAEPGKEPTRRSEPAFPTEPASVQGLLAQRKSGKALGLPLRWRHAELPAEVDGSTTMAALALLSEARGHADQPPRRDSELLPDQGSLRRRRSYQR